MTNLAEAEKYLNNVLMADKSNEEQIKLYCEIAHKYDQICRDTLYYFPERFSVEFEKFNLPHDSKILDVGSGTGLLGKVLHSLKYTNIDALEPSENMLEISRTFPHVYKNFIHATVVPDEVLPIPENTYDVAVMCGSASPAHIHVSAYKQIIRVVRPGGLIGWVMGDPNARWGVNARFRDNSYTNALNKLVDEKLWVAVEGYNPKNVENVVLKKPGQVYFYKVL